MCSVAPRDMAGFYFRVREVLVDKISRNCGPLFVGVRGGALDTQFVQFWSATTVVVSNGTRSLLEFRSAGDDCPHVV